MKYNFFWCFFAIIGITCLPYVVLAGGGGGGSVPAVTTGSASDITDEEATFSATVTASSGSNVTARGFEYGLDTLYGTTVSDSGLFGLGFVSLSQFGSTGNGNGQMYLPAYGTVDSAGNIFIVETGNARVQKFSASFSFESIVANIGSGGIALDNDENLYVVVANTVQKFNSSGTYLTEFGSTGSGDGELSTPRGIVVDEDDNIYVVDSFNARVQKFNSDGVYQSQFGSSGSGNGQFLNPYGIALDSSGNIYVVDTGNDRVQKFDSAGNYLLQFGTSGSGNGQFDFPVGIAINSDDVVFISDSSLGAVQRFDTAGVFISKTNITAASGIFIDDNAEHAYITDQVNNRVYVYSDWDGTFERTVAGLGCDVTYHFRAFATNTTGTGNGSDATFTTDACPTYTLYFDEGPGGITSESGISDGEVVTLPVAPTRIGYVFQNWNTESDGAGTAYAAEAAFTMIAEDVTLYAIWQAEAEPTPEEEEEEPSSYVGGSTLWHRQQRTNNSLQTIIQTKELPFGPVLKLYMRQDSVRELQKYLNQHGYIVSTQGAGSTGFETNYFGLRTYTAVVNFQKNNGLVPDGIVGPKTFEKMLAQ